MNRKRRVDNVGHSPDDTDNKVVKRKRRLRNSNTMDYYEAERKKMLLPFGTTWMELESMMLREIR